MSERVVVAMSGGVDSSVAAALVKEAGYDPIGITLRLWAEERADGFSARKRCCGVEDVDDARRVAQQLNIPHYTLNLEKPFQRFVVDPFVDAYAHGRTPNPCLNCNTYIKFDLFLEQALALKAAYIATGHYARRLAAAGGPQLHRARDREKDQSYVLYTLSPRALQRTLFPLGDLRKEQVRAIAARHELDVADKPDSADICFVPDGDYREFVRARLPDRPGPLLSRSGSVLGSHPGVQHFTVGQRRGLGITTGAKMYVTAIDADRNSVQLGAADDLLVEGLEAEDVHWLLTEPPAGPIAVQAKVRYRTEPIAASVRPRSDRRATVRLHSSARAVAPGQSVVFYQGERVLGGGVITRTYRALPVADLELRPADLC